MFESWVAERKNLHLRNAFLLRKAGDYPNALKELQIAVDEGDLEAQWVMWNAYHNGGFGLYKDHIKRDKYSTPEWSPHDNRNPEIHPDEAHENYAAECGNAHWQWFIGDCKNGWMNKAYEQNHAIAIRHICICHVNGCSYCNDKYTVLEIAYKIVEKREIDTIRFALENIRDPELRLQEFYIYGKFLDKVLANVPKGDIAKSIYRSTIETSQKAVLYWLWISKQFLVPDLRRLIGQMVWESRTRPEEWIQKEINNKKQKI